jgi:glycosyltransferase involved in cell wall biosynthesis
MTLRVCHLGKFYPPAAGGVEIHVQTLARAQARLGADVRVICVSHRNAAKRDVTWERFASTPTVEEWDEGVHVTRLGRQASLSRLDLCPSLPRALWRLRDERIDIVHVHAPNPTMFLALAALPPFGTLVVTHHSDVIKQRVLGRVFAPVERRVHNRARLILSDSEAYVDGSAVLQALRHKVRTLPLGLNLAAFLSPSPEILAAKARLRSEHGQPLWLAVGRLVYYKGLATAVDALAQVPGRLLVIGAGPMERELRERAADRRVAHRIEWAGHVDQNKLMGAYRAATALWFPSIARSEGFGLVQVEAMASGCPVINTEIPGSGVPWVSRDGETGFTVPPKDAAALAIASKRLLADPALRERLAAGAIDRACRDFDDAVMARKAMDLYAEVLPHGSRGQPHEPRRRGHADTMDEDMPRARPNGHRPPRGLANGVSKPERLRTLHLYSGNLYGGVETFLRTLAHYRTDAPWMATDVALSFEGRLARELRAEGVDVHLIGQARASSPWLVSAARASLTRLDSGNYDVVVCHSAWPHALGAPVVREAALPLVHHMHDVPNWLGWPDLLANRTPPDLVICNSEFMARSGSWFFKDVSRRVVRYPVSLAFEDRQDGGRDALRASLGAATDAVVVLEASCMQPRNGHRVLLAALERLPKSVPWVCWIAGVAQRQLEISYECELRSTVERLRLAGRVRFLGQREDVPALMRAADIFCPPNAGPDLFGIVFIEALAAGLPVVATKMGRAVEIVGQSCGLLVEANGASVAEALEELIRDERKRREFSRAGPVRAHELCVPGARVRDLAAVLGGLVRRGAIAKTVSGDHRPSAANSPDRAISHPWICAPHV